MWSLRNFLLIALFALQACGFQPLHGKQSNVDSRWLASVEVQSPDTRLGQLLRIAVEDALNPKGTSVPPQYHLVPSVESVFSPVSNNLDGSISRFVVQVTSHYELVRKADAKVVDSGKFIRNSSYNVAQTDDYATFVARQDAEERLMKELSELYRLKLRSYFDRFATVREAQTL